MKPKSHEWMDDLVKKVYSKEIKVMKARERVIKAAKRFHKTYIGSTHCDCPDDALYNAIDALIELEKQK